jgi:hypothetical protein
MPKLRNDLTLLLSSKKASDLITTEGKESWQGDQGEDERRSRSGRQREKSATDPSRTCCSPRSSSNELQ